MSIAGRSRNSALSKDRTRRLAFSVSFQHYTAASRKHNKTSEKEVRTEIGERKCSLFAGDMVEYLKIMFRNASKTINSSSRLLVMESIHLSQ